MRAKEKGLPWRKNHYHATFSLQKGNKGSDGSLRSFPVIRRGESSGKMLEDRNNCLALGSEDLARYMAGHMFSWAAHPHTHVPDKCGMTEPHKYCSLSIVEKKVYFLFAVKRKRTFHCFGLLRVSCQVWPLHHESHFAKVFFSFFSYVI